MFWKKKVIAKSDVEPEQKQLTDFKEFEAISKELIFIRNKLDFIEHKTELIQTDFRSLRRKINQNIYPTAETENLKSSDGLDSIRGL